MTDRIDQLNDRARWFLANFDELDLAEICANQEAQLAVLRQVARGYCPNCGRGDAGPTADDWEQQRKRAEQAEHRLRLSHQARRSKEQQLDGIRRALCDIGFMEDDDPYSHADLADAIRQAGEAETGPAATQATDVHVYLSTGCLHGQHDYCQSNTGLNGTKKPASCKFCAAPCTCPCHQQPATVTEEAP